MRILGIETSCDETAAALVDDGLDVRSSVVSSQARMHEVYGGVVPEIASRAHLERILPVIRAAMSEAETTLADLDAVAVASRPGLIGPLLIGVSAAKALSWSLGIPLVGVDHVRAHLHAALLGRDRADLNGLLPALGLVVSGGHSSIYRWPAPDTEDHTDETAEPRRLGSTIDDALGEAFDKVATMLGLPYPGGPALDALASSDDADDRAHDFPVSRLGRGSLDFSFSGLKTAVLYTVRGVPGRDGAFAREAGQLDDRKRRDIAASFQRAAVRAVLIKLERALPLVEGCRSIIAGGGVAANSRLRRELAAFADGHGVRLLIPPVRYCVDNAAMIAGLGHELLAAGQSDGLGLSPTPTTAM